MKYKYLFTDLDDTLLNNERKISEGNKRAAEKMKQRGVNVVICSGRSFMSLDKFNNEMGLKTKDNIGIAYNGGILYKPYNNEVILEHKIRKKNAKEIIDMCKGFKGADIIVYKTDTLIASELTENVKDYCELSGLEPLIIGDIDSYADEDISKILLKGDREALEEIEKIFLKSDLSKDVTTFFTNKTLFEFNPKGIDKGSALIEAAEYLGLSTDEFIAVGDNYNDDAMIKTAGLGIAVANAVDAIKPSADYITQRTNDESVLEEIYDIFIK